MTDERPPTERIALNRKRTVTILYKLRYGLSQVCNWLRTEQVMGGACSRSKVCSLMNTMSQNAGKKIDEVVVEVIINKCQLVLIVDDYTTIHSIRRPQDEELTNANFFCTIIIKVFKNVPAIPACHVSTYYNPSGLNVTSCINTVSGPSTMHKLSLTYSSLMPPWITDTFFNPEFERHRATAHEYCHHESVQTMRQMDNVHLVNFFQLTLKSKNDFDAAFDLVLSTKLSEYLKLFLIPQPGDWPAQFYSRQVIYETLQKFCCPSHVFDNPQVCPTDHSYARVCSSGPIQQQMNVSTSGQPGILSIIPCIGPLHISLNGRETVFQDYRQFFETVYNNLFPKSKLAKNPKPWRISLILEVVYSGWLFIRDSVKSKFCFCKDLEYRTLLNLIDNYLPLVLSIYSVTYKQNNFQKYLNAMIRIWVMFVCLKRHHYNKAPLVWLSMCSYWGMHHPALYKLLLTNLVIFDEYPVENTHSIIRSKTNTHDTAEQIQKKAKVVFQSKMEQQHFKQHFTQPKKP